MDEKLKYRLVGATVLFALAAFFLPLILDSEKYRTQIQSQIPAIPDGTVAEGLDSEENASSAQESGSDDDSSEGSLIINLNESSEKPDNSLEDNSLEEPPINAEFEKNNDSPQDTVEKTTSTNKPIVEKKSVISNSEQVPNKETSKKKAAEKADAVVNEVKATVKKKPLPAKKTPVFTQTDYVIQVATFSEKSNATQLVERLRSDGFRAYTRPNQSLTRVFVGPYPDKDSAEQRKSALEKVIKGKVVIMPFNTKVH